MTREEKIICKDFLNDADKTHSCNEYKLLMALLEQESSEDCISREQALLALTGIDLPTDRDKLIALFTERIQNLPPVTPQRPKGKWIEVLEHKDENSSTWHYECSECEAISYKGFEPLEKYCPNCGAEMKEVEDEVCD